MKNYEAYRTRGTTANTMLSLSPNTDGRKSTGRYGGIWERFFTSWRSRRKVASWKGI